MHDQDMNKKATLYLVFFFFNDTATTEIYPLSLHDALPIWRDYSGRRNSRCRALDRTHGQDRKSTRLNSSHGYISYAVFCLEKKKHRSHHSTPSRGRRPSTLPDSCTGTA